MKTTTHILLIALLATTIAVVAYLGQQFLGIQKEATNNQAVDGCMNVAKFIYEDRNAGTNSIMVIEDIYNTCLELKENTK